MAILNAMIENDLRSNLADLLKTRRSLRKCADCSKAIGYFFMYASAALSSLASGSGLVGSQALCNAILFASTSCLACHILFFGLARYGARQEGGSEELLYSIAESMGLHIVPLKPDVENEPDNGIAPPSPARPCIVTPSPSPIEEVVRQI